MATRSSLDRGLLIWLFEYGDHDSREALMGSSMPGLLGPTGLPAPAPQSIVAMAAAMDGLDALVFGSGVGERSSQSGLQGRTACGLWASPSILMPTPAPFRH